QDRDEDQRRHQQDDGRPVVALEEAKVLGGECPGRHGDGWGSGSREASAVYALIVLHIPARGWRGRASRKLAGNVVPGTSLAATHWKSVRRPITNSNDARPTETDSDWRARDFAAARTRFVRPRRRRRKGNSMR